MPALSSANFPQFFNSTRAQKLTGAEYVFNAARAVSYPMLMLVRGQDPFNIVRGGTNITEVVKNADTNTFDSYNPGDQASISNVNTSTTLTYYWRWYRNAITWTDAEYMLNTNGGSFVQVKRFAKMKEQDRISEHIRGWNATLFARPNGDTMEAAGPTTSGAAFSLLCYITENSNRWMPPSAVWSQSTVAGGNPSTDSTWRNSRETYVHTTPSDQNNGILAAFDKMEINLKFQPVPEAGDAMQDAKPSDLVIFTNKDGFVRLQAEARVSQDRWVKHNDASFGDPTYDDIPVIHAPQLNTELLEVDGYGSGAAYTGAAYTSGKPRYFWVNKRHTHPVMLEGESMKPEPAARDPVSYPDRTVVWTKTSFNLVCNARNRNGVVLPATPGA